MTTEAPDEAEELEILHPEREVAIAGETVTVREYNFIDGLTIERQAQPLVRALNEAMGEDEGPDELGRLSAVFGDHHEAVITLMARACGCSEAWVRGLSDADGQQLMMSWWGVNAGFFARRLAMARAAATAQAANAARSGLDGSTPSSSPPAIP